MKHHDFLIKNLVLISILLPLMSSCSKKDFEGYEKVVGTATINGQNYKEATKWAWNFNGYPSNVCLYKNYKLFHFLARLSPEKGNNPKHVIYFYVSESDLQLKLNHPYKIDYYKELDVESLFWGHVIPYFSENKSKVLAEGADGIAYVLTSDSDEAIPLKGEFIIEEIVSSERDVCYGSYSLTSSGINSEAVTINGKFETTYYLSNFVY